MTERRSRREREAGEGRRGREGGRSLTGKKKRVSDERGKEKQ